MTRTHRASLDVTERRRFRLLSLRRAATIAKRRVCLDQLAAAIARMERSVVSFLSADAPMLFSRGIAVASVPCYNRGIPLWQVMAGRLWQGCGRQVVAAIAVRWIGLQDPRQRTRPDPADSVAFRK